MNCTKFWDKKWCQNKIVLPKTDTKLFELQVTTNKHKWLQHERCGVADYVYHVSIHKIIY